MNVCSLRWNDKPGTLITQPELSSPEMADRFETFPV